jgi:hypothetical protein
MKNCREFQFPNLRTTPIARFSFRMQIQETRVARQFHDNYLITSLFDGLDQRDEPCQSSHAATGCVVIILTAVFLKVSVWIPQFLTVLSIAESGLRRYPTGVNESCTCLQSNHSHAPAICLYRAPMQSRTAKSCQGY